MDEAPRVSTPTTTHKANDADMQKILDLLRGVKPEPPPGIRASQPMPTTGQCSYAAAVVSHTDIQYTSPVKRVAGIGRDTAIVHGERGVTVSWPKDIYLKLKAATPEVRDTDAAIFEITRRSFESLVPRDGLLQSVVQRLGIDMLAPYTVTSYDCLPPLGQR
jgi:hypothetical protein